MRLLAGLALLLVLAAQPVHAQNTAEAQPAALPSSAELFIADIYKTYTDNPHDDPEQAGEQNIYSKHLQTLFDKDEAETPQGEVGRLDFDPFVGGQDWELSGLEVKETYRSGDEAQVRADFASFGDPRSILFSLVREDGAWRIDDISSTLPPRWTLSDILSGTHTEEVGE